MKEQLEGNMVHSITLSNNEITWARKGKEIIVGDKLFDVKSISYKENGTVVITGLFDKEETALLQDLQKHQQENNSRDAKQLAQLFQLLLSLPEPLQDNNDCFTVAVNRQYILTTSSPLSAFRTIPTPPPQC